jgi:hypothetical protein
MFAEKVTLMDWGLLMATLDVTGTVAVYVVPDTRLPDDVAVSVSVVGADVALKLAVSQPVSCPDPYVIVPTPSPLSFPNPLLETFTVLGSGFTPWVELKLTLVGLRAITEPLTLTANISVPIPFVPERFETATSYRPVSAVAAMVRFATTCVDFTNWVLFTRTRESTIPFS